MKKSLLTLACALLACLAITACGVGQAHAGTLTQNFAADNGAVFEVSNALSFKKIAGAVEVVAINGTTYTYPDASGGLYTRLLSAPTVTSHYQQVPGTLEHMNTAASIYIVCSGTQTVFAYPGSIAARYFADNCALQLAVKNASS